MARGSLSGLVHQNRKQTQLAKDLSLNKWRAQHDSNVRPPPSEGGTLSTELWALKHKYSYSIMRQLNLENSNAKNMLNK